MSTLKTSALHSTSHLDPVSARPLPRPMAGLPLLGSALAMQRDTLGFLQRVDRERGPMASFRVGPFRWVLASRPPEIEDVLVGQGQHFEKPDAIYGHGRMIFGNALTGLKGTAWRRRRSIVAPAFHQQSLDAQRIAGVLDGWSARVSAGPDFELAEELKLLMTQVVCSNLLAGVDAQPLVGPASAALEAMGARARAGVPLPDWLALPPVSTMRRAVGRLDRSFDASVGQPLGAGMPRDLRERLSALREQDGRPTLEHAAIRAEINVMVAVGGHQLALALAWALHLLDRHPDTLRSLQQEVDTVLGGLSADLTDLDALPFTGQVLDETLRLYPPFYLIGREALRDTSVAGWRIPRGTTVILSPWVTQRLPEYFEAPDRFHPTRWTAELRRELPRAAYFPWGGGGRLCVAQAAARKQLALVLATLTGRYRVRFDRRQRVEPRTTTSLEMRRGVTASLVARA